MGTPQPWNPGYIQINPDVSGYIRSHPDTYRIYPDIFGIHPDISRYIQDISGCIRIYPDFSEYIWDISECIRDIYGYILDDFAKQVDPMDLSKSTFRKKSKEQILESYEDFECTDGGCYICNELRVLHIAMPHLGGLCLICLCFNRYCLTWDQLSLD
jgi:hypothetical protein